MDKFIKIQIKTDNQEQRDILIAELSESGYEFEEERNMLNAYISSGNFDKISIDNLLSNKNITYSLSEVLQRNWNEEWEAGFEPVVVDDYCCVRASFHAPAEGVEHDVVVTPRMSFGTGHHATTYMMVQAMRKLPIKDKTVLDFGTGTGVLAILAHKCGAGKIVAIDNDDWSIDNAAANFMENDVPGIQLIKADSIKELGVFDLILANINRNIILQSLPDIKQHLSPNGVVLLSGLLEDDKDIVLKAMEKEGLMLKFQLERDSWLCMTAEG